MGKGQIDWYFKANDCKGKGIWVDRYGKMAGPGKGLRTSGAVKGIYLVDQVAVFPEDQDTQSNLVKNKATVYKGRNDQPNS